MQVAASHQEERRVLRLPLDVDVAIRGRDFRQTAHVVDISQLGCRIASPTFFQAGAYLLVTFEGFAAIDTEVAWSDGCHVGVAFRTPLHAAVVDHIVARAGEACAG